MRAGCWRFLHANDDKVTACGFRNHVRSRKLAFGQTVWLFREFSVTICVAILISGVVSVTLTPMLCSRFLRKPSAHGGGGRFGRATEAGFQWLLMQQDNDLMRFYAAVRELSKKPKAQRDAQVCKSPIESG